MTRRRTTLLALTAAALTIAGLNALGALAYHRTHR